MKSQLRISGSDYEQLRRHLFPPDGKEAVAVALCGRHINIDQQVLLVNDLKLIPYNECQHRENDVITWSTNSIHEYFKRVAESDYALLKIHSHPGGYERFSNTDDVSDLEFFDSAFGWSSTDHPHASAIMLPSGKIFGRFFFNDLHYEPIDKLSVVGDTVLNFSNHLQEVTPSFSERTIQAFGEKTYKILSNLTIGVVGCSGTGSVVIEQLARLGIMKVVLVDPDIVEEKNLNRILNSTKEDVKKKKTKVDIIANALKKIQLGTIVEPYASNLYDDIKPLKALVKCDVVFGCLDTVDGRHLLNQLCTFYLLPYFDLGVKLEADGTGGIKQICGSVHYIQPSKSSLLTRGVYTMADLRASSQYRKNPEEFHNLRKNSYITNVNVNNPAVISVNMQIASHAVNEFLNRIHPYKSEHPSSYAASTIDITEGYIVNSSESDFKEDPYLKQKCGRGDMLPFIEMPELS